MKKINVVIIGTGFGEIAHLPAYLNSKYTNVIGIFGRNKNKLKLISKKYRNIEIYKSIKQILEDETIDLVSLALPPFLNFKIINKLIKSNKNILCEKPFTLEFAQSEILQKKIKQTDLIGTVGYQMRFDPLRKTVKNFIENEELGEIFHVNLSYDFSSFFSIQKKNSWANNISLGGGVLNSMGSHQLDLLVWWLGKIHNISFGQKIVQTKSSKVIISNNSDNITKGLINFEEGALVNFSVSNSSIGWKNSNIEIYGSKAALFINGEKEMTLHRSTGAFHNFRFDNELLSKGWVGGSIWRAAFFRQIEDLAIKIIDKKNTFNGSTFEEASYIRKIMDNIQRQNNKNNFQLIK